MNIKDAITLYTDACRVNGLSERSIETYVFALSAFADFVGHSMKVDTILPHHCRSWYRAMQEQGAVYENHPSRKAAERSLSPATIHGRATALRTFSKWLVEDGLIDKSFFRNIKLPAKPPRPKRKRDIDQADYLRLLEAAKDSPAQAHQHLRPLYAARDVAILKVLRSTGCRAGGLCGMEISDIYGDAIRVREKTGERFVYLTSSAKEALEHWLKVRPKQTHQKVFFTMPKGVPMKPKRVRDMLNRLAKRAGVDGNVNPHSFRHAFAKQSVMYGASISTVSQLLGHSNVTTTHDYYAQMEPNELRELHRQVTRWMDDG